METCLLASSILLTKGVMRLLLKANNIERAMKEVCQEWKDKKELEEIIRELNQWELNQCK